ncbi:hypothetical protein Sme01_03280 [Sphaerisporangium melleum]|uniref:Uncharacterized protein n=1 Tax=Sphaerisporangium melleum TaxID=321316 RepID=A0A917QNW9_9ACTN|nr:hypothetical protein [Sphaerisporangium melleum]GGK61529.1 hypothetical protein GCM10007964_00820 [Sphaerisporangium melleum]GII67852.1 hypothetical protein Sme01_03280 [Sphaerisporangium melleum]
MIVIQVAFVMLVSLVAVIALAGFFGLLNLALLGFDAGWRAHVAVWAGSVLVLCLVAVAMPRYIQVSPEGDRLIFSYDRPAALSQKAL